VVVFTSDNGYLVGEHRLLNKVYAYRESLSVAMLVRGPGVPRGSTRSQLVSLADLPVTFAALAHAAPDLVVDGTDVMPYARHNRRQPATTQLIETSADASRRWTYRGVRTARYTYVEWVNGFRELYDRRTDPAELRNLARGRTTRIEHVLATRLDRLRDCAGPACKGRLGPLRRPAAFNNSGRGR
jgi:N-acetylglucosamine-6-sulfatase